MDTGQTALRQHRETQQSKIAHLKRQITEMQAELLQLQLAEQQQATDDLETEPDIPVIERGLPSVMDSLAHNQLLHHIADAIPIMIYIFDRQQNRTVYMNRYTQAFFGLLKDRIQQNAPDTFQMIIHPDDLPQMIDFLEQWKTAQDDDVFVKEYRLKNAEGAWRWVRSQEVVFQRGADGEVSHVLGSALDITGQKEAEREFYDKQARYRNLFDHNNDAVFLVDLDGIIVEANQQAVNLLGYPHDEIIGTPSLEFIAPAEHDQSEDRRQRVLTGERLPFYERNFRRKDGSTFTGELNVALIRDKDGNPSHVQSIVRDLTERKLQEARSLAMQAEQERMCVLATFVRDASHEFRTPLSVINANVYMLRKSEGEQRELFAERIQNAVRNVESLLDGMVTMSGLDSSPQFNDECVNLNQVLNDILVSLQSRISAAEIDFSMILHARPIRMEIDPTQLHLIIWNIVGNAISYTPPGGQVVVKSTLEDEQVAITIQDTGIGMDEQTMQRIFERFYRADPARTKLGFGLGLPIARSIVTHYQGRIEVESQPDVGSTFTIYLPRCDCQSHTSTNALRAENADS